MGNTKIKICGLTNTEDIEAVNTNLPEYAGFVLFFPKSRRNIEIERAKELKEMLNGEINSVAVVVSPSKEQARLICECRFDYIQIHGNLSEEVLEEISIPIIKAFNITDLDKFDEYNAIDKIKGFVFDASTPGSGKTFDWNLLKTLPHTDKMIFLSGGLHPDNVCEAINLTNPEIVDVSSGVEYKDRSGKDPELIRKFIEAVRS